MTTMPGPYFHGLLDHQPEGSAMRALDDCWASWRADYTGRPYSEVFAALQQFHDGVGVALDIERGRAAAREIAADDLSGAAYSPS